MSELMTLAVSALRAEQARLEQTSFNTANATTPGYRRGTVASVGFEDTLQSQLRTDGVASSAASSAGAWSVPVLVRGVDLSSAGIQATGRDLDVAVEGHAYLALTDGSQTWLTRAGALDVDAEGYLVGPRGLRVVGQQGDIRIDGLNGLSMDAQGHLMREGQSVGQLRLMRPAEGASLVSADGIALSTEDGLYIDVPVGEARVRSGFLEASNVQGMPEVLGMVEGIRRFESVIRLVQGYDDVLGRTIQKLGEI